MSNYGTSIIIVADKFANFASYALRLGSERGFASVNRKMCSYNCTFQKEKGAPYLHIYWANHNDIQVMAHVSQIDCDEIHIVGPEIDEDMVDVFESIRDVKKKIKTIKVVSDSNN